MGAALVAALAWFVHAPALNAQAHCFDENEFLVSNPLVLNPSWHSVARFATEVLEPSTVAGYYAPLTMVSLMFDVALGGTPDDLTAFHRTNLSLHILNGVALVVLLSALSRAPEAAALAAALFVVHPLTVEPVAWIVERKTLLATFFSLLALIAYLRSSEAEAPGMRRAALFALVLACLAKPTAVVLPALMVALDHWPLDRLDLSKLDSLVDSVKQKLPFFVVAAAFAAITLISHDRTAGIEAPADGVLAPLWTAIHLLSFYLGKLVWPSALSPVYLLPEPLSLANARLWFDVAIVIALGSAAAVFSMRGVRAPLVGLAIFVLALTPTLGGLRYSWVTASDKYVYLPAIGIALVLAWGFARLWNRESEKAGVVRAGLVAVVLLLVGIEAAAARDQLAKWRTTEALYESMLELTPDVPLLHANLGQYHWQRGRVEAARSSFERAIALDANDAQSHNNLGVLYWSTNRPRLSLDHLDRAVAADPTLSAPHRNRGIALNGFGRFEEARQSFERALERDADDPQTHCGLALSLGQLGRREAARRHFERSLELAPGCALPPGMLR